MIEHDIRGSLETIRIRSYGIEVKQMVGVEMEDEASRWPTICSWRAVVPRMNVEVPAHRISKYWHTFVLNMNYSYGW